MNLRGGEITVGEVLQNPEARQLLQCEYPMLLHHPMLRMMCNQSLNCVIGYLRGKVPDYKINQIVNMLKNI